MGSGYKNKDIKMFRRQHTRKMSHMATNTDLINRLLLSSDPFLTGQRKLQCTKKSVLLRSAYNLLDGKNYFDFRLLSQPFVLFFGVGGFRVDVEVCKHFNIFELYF